MWRGAWKTHPCSLLLMKCYLVSKDQATDNAILDQLCKVDIPRSLFEEQGRQLYGSQLLQIQANMKLSEQQLASLSSPKAVNESRTPKREHSKGDKTKAGSWRYI
ncbi:trigger factor-like protein TIG, Chloroplastic [Euphorbia lathyris]|uniref:trigger factor-like protein TIG, Chloroplastic n=1 Tax=Euphorbia lathyris TaxID=212925 RepID=UPI003314041A